MPVCKTSVDAGETKAMTPTGRSKDAHAITPAQHWQQRMRNAGNDASTIRARTPAQCRQRHLPCINQTIEGRSLCNDAGLGNKASGVLQLRHDWADACLRCWQQWGCGKSYNASATRAKTPARPGQQHQRNAGDNDSAMLAMTPARCGRGHQCNASKDTSATPARSPKAKSP